MPEAFSIDIQGVEQLLQYLAGIQTRSLRVTTDLMRDTGLIIQAEVDQVFDSAPTGSAGGTVYGGVSWNSLTEAYLKRRPDRATGQIYRDTGELMQSLAVGGAGNILQASADTLTFGSALPKAGRLQAMREYLFVTDSMTDAIARRWEMFLLEGQ